MVWSTKELTSIAAVVKAISTLLVLLGKSLSLIMNLEYFDMA
jgi:hypothetical protein